VFNEFNAYEESEENYEELGKKRVQIGFRNDNKVH
jgi:hypothetical protein